MFDDISGRKFGKLLALERNGSSPEGHAIWLCKCDCGNYKSVRRTHLIRGSTLSCGCIFAERKPRKYKESVTNKNPYRRRIYNIWSGMLKRCRNENCKDYKHYGLRGIKVCEEWEDFEVFYEWAVSHGYEENLTLDRINNDGNYEPSNCRWATMKEQAKNKRKRQ